MDDFETERTEERRTTLANIPQLLHRSWKSIRGMVFAFGVAVACTSLNIFSYKAGETLQSVAVTLWISVTIMSLSAVALLFIRPPPPRSLKGAIFVIAGSFLTGGGSTSILIGIMLSEPAIAVSLLFTLPIILITLEAIILRRKLKTLHLLLTICSFVGVVFVTKPSFLFNGNSHLNLTGGLFGLLSAIFHGCGFMVLQSLEEVHTLILCFSSSSNVFIMSAILCIFLKNVVSPSSLELAMFLLSAGISHFLAYVCLFLALANERAYVVSIIMTFEVLFTFIAQWIILYLTPSLHSICGGFLISVACIGVALTKDEQVNGADGDDDGNDEEQLLNE